MRTNSPNDPPAAVLKVKLIPRSSRNLLAGKEGDTYRIKLTAPPVDGKANLALIGFLADALGISKGDVEIVSGKTSRSKNALISGLSLKQVHERLDRKLEVGG